MKETVVSFIATTSSSACLGARGLEQKIMDTYADKELRERSADRRNAGSESEQRLAGGVAIQKELILL